MKTWIVSSILISLSLQVCAADIPAAQAPASSSASASAQLQEKNTEIKMVARDTGVGLGVGTVLGLGFAALGPASGVGNSQIKSQMRTDALITGAAAGLVGGFVTGLWQVRKRKIALTVAPATANQPPSLGAAVSF